jgi:sulfur carrier protein
MKIAVNGSDTDVLGPSLATVLEELGYAGAKIATAVNAAFVPVTARQATLLQAGDRVEIVAPQQGG